MACALVKALSLLVCLVVLLESTRGLTCRRCYSADCPPRNSTEPNCPFGVVMAVCGCCYSCGRGPGEECGGSWGLLGTCGANYTCVKNESYGSLYDHYHLPGTCAHRGNITLVSEDE